MSTRLAMSSRPAKGLACAGLLTLLLGVTVGRSVHREGADLPAASERLRLATVASADLLACFQGVQDDLYSDTSGGTGAGAVSAAADRLRSCDVTRLDGLVERIDVPPAAAVTTAPRRKARAAIEEGAAALRRVVLDAEAARTAMAGELTGRNRAAPWCSGCAPWQQGKPGPACSATGRWPPWSNRAPGTEQRLRCSGPISAPARPSGQPAR